MLAHYFCSKMCETDLNGYLHSCLDDWWQKEVLLTSHPHLGDKLNLTSLYSLLPIYLVYTCVSIDELKAKICAEISAILRKMAEMVMKSLTESVRLKLFTLSWLWIFNFSFKCMHTTIALLIFIFLLTADELAECPDTINRYLNQQCSDFHIWNHHRKNYRVNL